MVTVSFPDDGTGRVSWAEFVAEATTRSAHAVMEDAQVTAALRYDHATKLLLIDPVEAAPQGGGAFTTWRAKQLEPWASSVGATVEFENVIEPRLVNHLVNAGYTTSTHKPPSCSRQF